MLKPPSPPQHTQGAKLTTSLSPVPHKAQNLPPPYHVSHIRCPSPWRRPRALTPSGQSTSAWRWRGTRGGRYGGSASIASQSVSQSVGRSSGEFARRWKWKGRMDGPCTPTDPNTHRAGLCGPHHGAANLLPPPLHARRQRPPLPPRRQRYAVVYTGCIHTPTHHRHAHLSAHPTQLTRADTLSAGTHVPCLLIGPLPPPPSRLPTHAFPKAAALGGGAEETGGGKSGR